MYLTDAKDVDTKISIERLIADIDFRVLTTVEKINHNTIRFWDEMIKGVNKVVENNNLDIRFTSLFELRKISIDSRISLDRLKEDAFKGKRSMESKNIA